MGSSTRKNIIIASAYAAVLIFGMFLGPKFAAENSNSRNGSFLPFADRSAKIDKVIQIINDNYVDPVKLDTLQDKAIENILKNLDPHTSYLPPVDAQLLSEDLEGNFNGIGIEYYILNDTLLVTTVSKGSPADKGGLKPGDQILKINNMLVAGTKVTGKQVVQNIRGKRGTSVNLLIERDGKLKDLRLIRDKITISSIDAAYMLDNVNGYVKIGKFGDQTDEDFLASLEKLQKSGMKNLVLDLRNNGGGYLNSATRLADQFLGDKKLIVYTQGLHEPRTDYYATPEGKFEQGKLIVLIDENTASASEIVAGAVQDLDRGTIIGRRSFGKGLVQEQFNFGDGSALNLTIARYYTPSGRSIQKSYAKGAEAYYHELDDRFKNGELSNGEGKADSALRNQKTYVTRSGKLVYGGGGIHPDIYVPVDTSGYTDYYQQISRKGVLTEFVYRYLTAHVPRFANAEQFIKTFRLSNEEYDKLVELAASKNVKASKGQIDLSRKVIETDLEALLARYYYGDEGFYKALNADDRVIARSLEVLK